MQHLYIDELASIPEEAIASLPRRYTFADVSVSLAGEELNLVDEVAIVPPSPGRARIGNIPDGWSGTMTVCRPKPSKPWEESDQRAMARVLCSPSLLPAGPEREAEIRRSRRRRRNREAVIAGGMVAHGWEVPTPLWALMRDRLQERFLSAQADDFIRGNP